MSTTNDGGPAFPVPDLHYPNGQVQVGSTGMSLRDYFAGQALAGFNARGVGGSAFVLAGEAYRLADAMLEVRERKQS